MKRRNISQKATHHFPTMFVILFQIFHILHTFPQMLIVFIADKSKTIISGKWLNYTRQFFTLLSKEGQKSLCDGVVSVKTFIRHFFSHETFDPSLCLFWLLAFNDISSQITGPISTKLAMNGGLLLKLIKDVILCKTTVAAESEKGSNSKILLRPNWLGHFQIFL